MAVIVYIMSVYRVSLPWAAGGTIGKSHNDMATDPDIESTLSASDTFCAAPEIVFASPIEDIIRDVIKNSESGVPCVITGFPLVEADEQSPFRQSTEWIESMYARRGAYIPVFLSTLSLKSYSSQRCVDRHPQHRGRPQRHR